MARSVEHAWAMQAAAGGLTAGFAFLAFEMVAGALLGGAEGAFMPLRMIGAIVLGPSALEPLYALPTAAIVGGVVHFLLSVCFALIFVALMQPTSTVRSTNTLLLSASIYGLVLWIVNFYVIAPSLGWNWFPRESNASVQLLAHTFFYGWILGLYLSRHATVMMEAPPHEETSHARRVYK